MEALVVKAGVVFSMVTESELATVALLESVAVAVQVIESPTLLSAAVTVYVDPVPNVVVPIVQT